MRDAILFESRRTWRVRIVQVVVWIAALVCAWLGYDGLRSNAPDALVACILAGAMVLGAIGIEIYLRRYVERIDRRGKHEVEITTPTTFGRRRFRVPISVLDAVSDEQWGTAYGAYSTWRWLKLPGHTFAFVLDYTDDQQSYD